jgi:hypothetical protein
MIIKYSNGKVDSIYKDKDSFKESFDGYQKIEEEKIEDNINKEN